METELEVESWNRGKIKKLRAADFCRFHGHLNEIMLRAVGSARSRMAGGLVAASACSGQTFAIVAAAAGLLRAFFFFFPPRVACLVSSGVLVSLSREPKNGLIALFYFRRAGSQKAVKLLPEGICQICSLNNNRTNFTFTITPRVLHRA